MVKTISPIIIGIIFLFSSPGAFAQSASFRNVEALILKENYAQAAKECKKILAGRHRSPIQSKAYYLLGLSLLKQERYEQARKNFYKILRSYSKSKFCDDATLGIADSYFLAGDYSQATQRYEQFLRDFPRSELIHIARKHLELCRKARPLANSYFSVQAGCFSSKRNAERLRRELTNKGFKAYVVELPGDNLYHVRVGKFSNRLKAEFLEQQLRSEGYPTKVCP